MTLAGWLFAGNLGDGDQRDERRVVGSRVTGRLARAICRQECVTNELFVDEYHHEDRSSSRR